MKNIPVFRRSQNENNNAGLECSCWFYEKHFWPNYLPAEYIQALKKMLPKWHFLFYPICYGQKWQKCFPQIFGRCFILTLHESERFSVCKFVGNRQHEKQITKITSLRKININPYPKCYHRVNSRGTMLVWMPTIFSNP